MAGNRLAKTLTVKTIVKSDFGATDSGTALKIEKTWRLVASTNSTF